MFHDRHELHETCSKLFQELINFQSPALACLVHRRHGIILYSVLIQKIYATDDLVESRRPAFVLAVFVMNVTRTVYRNAYKKIVFLEKGSEFRGNEGAVGLYGIADKLVPAIFLFQFHSFAVEVRPQYQRFAAVPVESDFLNIVGRNILPDAFLKHLIGHSRLPASVDIGLVEIIAVMTVQITERACRFEHDVELHRA